MKMMVCVKQVPNMDQIYIDETANKVIDSDGGYLLNPYCGYALDFALSMKEEGDFVTVVTMGPESAQDVLLECLERGADEAYHLQDQDFIESDSWATAQVLNRFISLQIPDYDVLFCGKQAIDGATSQVPAQLAHLAGAFQYYHVHSWKKSDTDIILLQDYGDEQREIILKPKSLVSISMDSTVDRVSNKIKGSEELRKNIKILTRESLNLKKEECGRSGSLTKVSKMFTPSNLNKSQKLPDIESASPIADASSKGV